VKKNNETRKATDKFKADDLEAIAEAGDWRLKREELHTRVAEEFQADAQTAGLRFSIGLESRARRGARKVGLVAYRCRTQHLGNLDQFQVVDPKRGNIVVAGQCYDMTALDVIKFCERRSTRNNAANS
jgi:hypothetical protein